MSEVNEGKKKRTLTGVVTSVKCDKTITVLVERRVAHPLYKKVIKRSSKLYAHDENNQCQVGDKVVVVETRPFSKQKSFELVDILDKVSQ